MGVSGYGGREEGRSRRIAVSGCSFANIFLSVVCTFVPALVLIAIAPNSAFAAQYGDVVYGPAATGLTTGEYYVQVYAFNRYEAAAAALGNNIRDTTIFTDEVKAKLSNESTGGDFYDFAQKFTDDEYSGGFNPITSSAADLNMQSAYKLNVDMYGSNSIFWAKFTESEAGAASAALARVAAGESGGSGSGSGGGIVDDGTNVTITVTPYDATIYTFQSTNNISYYDNNNWYVYKLGSTNYYNKVNASRYNGAVANEFGLSIPKAKYNALLAAAATTGWSDAMILINGSLYSSSNRYNVSAKVVHGDLISRYNDVNGNFVAYNYPNGTQYAWLDNGNGRLYFPSTWPSTNAELANALVWNELNPKDRVTGYNTFSSDSSTPNIWWDTYNTFTCLFDANGVVGTEPTVPPTNWPDDGEPVAPSPPELPDPSPPETPNPPQDPTPSPNPTYNVEINYPDFTYVTADLSVILDAMNSHCEHLRHALYDNLTEFWRLLSTKLTNDFATLRSFLSNQFGWQTSAIEGYFDDLSDYLYDLFHWLADQFDFTFGSGDGGYDDRSLLYWLRRIYYKLGTGTTVKPVDPVVEPDAWWKWLEQLFNNFVIDLLALGANGLADVMDGLRTLITKFPFSMPWDIAAILGLLVSEPVTPSVTWPIYSVSSGFQLSQVGTMTIDLDDYSDVWEGVRNMERIAFAVFLAWHITKFTDMMPSKEKTI